MKIYVIHNFLCMIML